MKRSALGLFAAIAFLATAAQADERIVKVFGWSDYIDPSVLEDFTRETGVKVIYDSFNSDETLETRLLAGKSGYDVVIPSAPLVSREIRASVLQQLDKEKIPNLKNLSPDIAALLSRFDPGNQYSINYMWYTTGIVFNVAKAKERLGDKPLTSWDQALRPENTKKFADCGVYISDNAEDVFSITLNWLKLDPRSRKPEDLRRAADHLIGLRRYNTKFHSLDMINALANGDICLAIASAGDALQAHNRAREAGAGVEIDFVAPQDGALISLDNLAVPRDAPHKDEAYLFIDYLLRPEVAARNSKLTGFPNGVQGSHVTTNGFNDANSTAYPSDATMKRSFTVAAPDPAVQKMVAREWSRVKTGR